MTSYDLTDDERAATVAALWAYCSETTHYLRGYESADLAHDDCCPMSRARSARRREERDALNARLRAIDGALLTLDPDGTP